MKSPLSSSTDETFDRPAELRKLLSTLLGRRVSAIRSVGGGRNSRVYRVDAPPSPPLAAKFFIRNSPERRQRSAVEFQGLEFLWRHGERSIPRPLSLHPEQSCALYEFVEGSPVPPPEVRMADVDQATAFLSRLKALAARSESRGLPPAAEACFSLEEIAANLRVRTDRLLSVEDSRPPYPALRAFLKGGFRAASERLLRRAGRILKGLRTILPLGFRTLSPSDFGFHNSIRKLDGSLVFVDFEYFGWDDPAKTISDFLLHPAMRLSTPGRRRFVRGALEAYPGDSNLAKRVDSFYPLFGLKWCLILLNEFVPEDLSRRTFAGRQDIDPDKARRRQLGRARRLLARISDIKNGPLESP